MLRPAFGIALIVVLVSGVVAAPQADPPSPVAGVQSDHVRWVAAAMERMRTITPGMTRAQALAVFTTEGGIATRLEQTYVFRGCPYFKVDVQFEAADGAIRDAEGRLPMAEMDQDRILKISKPYLELTRID